MQAKDVMKEAIEAFREDDPVSVVAIRMRDLETGFVPICDRQGHPVGTVSDHDIVRNVCAEDRLASKTLVGEIMDRGIVTCYDDDALQAVEQRMHDSRRARVLVLDRDQKLVGVVTLADILRSEDEHVAASTARELVPREYLA
jgi:CBS domain-containing protein